MIKRRLNFVIDEEIYEQLRVTSFESRRSMSRIINEVLRTYFEKQIKHQLLQKEFNEKMKGKHGK